MAAPDFIPLETYLRTTYRPDCDYVNGVVMHRAVGTTPHAGAIGLLSYTFYRNRQVWGLRPFSSVRVKVSATRVRVADFCVVRLPSRPEHVITHAPLLCVEILSPEDSLSDMKERSKDYLAMGVQHVWIFDPVRRYAWVATDAGFLDVTGDAFEVPGTPIRIPLAEINAELDDIAAGR